MQNFSNKKRMSGKRRWRRSKKADRAFERLERERAQREEKAHRESQKHQERIKVLWEELQKEFGRAKELAKDRVGAILLELVILQRDEIKHMRRFHELCEWAKTHAPEELDPIEIHRRCRHLTSRSRGSSSTVDAERIESAESIALRPSRRFRIRAALQETNAALPALHLDESRARGRLRSLEQSCYQN